ncbi:hypothetical protein [Mycobacterium lehmannii]|uniref:hypothetical protein n=1 Tax=Mycobacterium lehmannii TaxID=2048550 RepID=UPI000B943AAB|nr:hypothetical protein [Mycobacterium lehmannii]
MTTPTAPRATYTDLGNRWTFRYRGGEKVHQHVPLVLTAEVDYAAFEDDYLPDEISARDLFREWVKYVHRNQERKREVADLAAMPFGDDDEDDWPCADAFDDSLSISWFVSSPVMRGGRVFEAADQCPARAGRAALYPALRTSTFSTYWTTPIHSVTGDEIDWWRVPFDPGHWARLRPGERWYTAKGAYIYEATGWTPTPFQATVSLRYLAERAGVAHLVGAR